MSLSAIGKLGWYIWWYRDVFVSDWEAGMILRWDRGCLCQWLGSWDDISCGDRDVFFSDWEAGMIYQVRQGCLFQWLGSWDDISGDTGMSLSVIAKLGWYIRWNRGCLCQWLGCWDDLSGETREVFVSDWEAAMIFQVRQGMSLSVIGKLGWYFRWDRGCLCQWLGSWDDISGETGDVFVSDWESGMIYHVRQGCLFQWLGSWDDISGETRMSFSVIGKLGWYIRWYRDVFVSDCEAGMIYQVEQGMSLSVIGMLGWFIRWDKGSLCQWLGSCDDFLGETRDVFVSDWEAGMIFQVRQGMSLSVIGNLGWYVR